jgi:2-hydroxy-3-keto-5-methylthiopentenyl-1-phosphate phosphatase
MKGGASLSKSVFISDFDGTITAKDFYLLAVERCTGPETPDYWALYSSGKITHFEAMQAFLSHAPAGDGELRDLLAATKPDPQLGMAAACLKKNGWNLVAASAGSCWYIERIFAETGVAAEAYSNPGRIEKGRGLS